MTERKKLRVPIRLAGRPVASETLIATVGAYVLVIETCLPDRGLELHSTYSGDGCAASIAAHLGLAPDGRSSAWHKSHDPASVPVIHTRRACLYDHLHTLQSWLGELGHPAEIDTLPAALEALER